MADPTAQQVLNCPIEDGDAPTIGGFFKEALHALWKETEGFSGKKPLGNSGWDWEIYAALVRAEMIAGDFDHEGYLDFCDEQAGDRLIHAAIDAMIQSPDPTPDVPDGFCPGVGMVGSDRAIERHPARPYQLRYNGYCQACAAHLATVFTNQGTPAPAWAVRALIDRLQFERGRSSENYVDL